jgi:hypothetical protein
MRPRWLAWAAFILGPPSRHEFSRLDADWGKIHKHERQGVHHLVLDYSLFILLYLDSTYAAEKIWFVPGFPKTLLDVHKPLAASIVFALRT